MSNFKYKDENGNYISLVDKEEIENPSAYIYSEIEPTSTNKIWCKVIPLPPAIGGRIFYDDGANGATYTFYDANMNIITDTSISGLANAYYYTVSGTPTKDRFYVYNPTLKENVQWGKLGTSIGIKEDGIGKGKTNTAKALAQSGWASNSIFSYVQSLRDANTGGCNDWYIGTTAEQDKLRASGLVNWYSNKFIWSSVEGTGNPTNYALYWIYSSGFWLSRDKDNNLACYAQRSF